ncbi:MAG: helix-turn-helix domain-containing protein [Nitrososphaeraceae archaeon]|jgi:IS30 family transposase
MNQSRSEINRQQIEWRHSQVIQLAADGYSEREIAAQLHLSQPTIHRDIALLRQQSKDDIHRYITDQVPYEYKKTLAGLEGIIKFMSSIIADDTKDTKEKMQALNMKMELVSSANLVEEAINLVEQYRGSIDKTRK